MDEEALRVLPKVEKRTGYLAMLGNLATLAGLLGTITGLIKSFASVAGVDPAMKATMLSKGISEAMNCTAFGLGTGILGLAVFAWLNGKTQGIMDGVNQGAVEALNLVVAGRNQLGLHARTSPWPSLGRGLNREAVDADGRLVSHVTDETTNRGFWRHYRTVMTEA